MGTHTNTDPRPAGESEKSRPTVPPSDRLGDFTADSRLVVLSLMAIVVGVISALVATVLVWLIGAVTNLAYYHRLASEMVSPAGNRLASGLSWYRWRGASSSD